MYIKKNHIEDDAMYCALRYTRTLHLRACQQEADTYTPSNSEHANVEPYDTILASEKQIYTGLALPPSTTHSIELAIRGSQYTIQIRPKDTIHEKSYTEKVKRLHYL